MKLYRQVSTSERMPDKYERYITNQGFVVFTNKGGYNYWFIDGEQSKVQWWLEEIEIPSEDDIFRDGVKMGYTESDYSLGVFKDGAEYILNKLKG